MYSGDSRGSDVADVPDAILTGIQRQFYHSPTKAVIVAMGMEPAVCYRGAIRMAASRRTASVAFRA